MEQCFSIWITNGRPGGYALWDLLPEEEGRKPGYSTLDRWRKIYGWEIRADEIDSKAIQIQDDYLATRKADILRQQAENAMKIADKAMSHLVSGTFDSSSSAVAAYFKATEEVRMAIGVSDLIVKLSKMSDDELQDEIRKQLNRASESGQIVEAEEVDTESETKE
jgi:hypothetical protein